MLDFDHPDRRRRPEQQQQQQQPRDPVVSCHRRRSTLHALHHQLPNGTTCSHHAPDDTPAASSHDPVAVHHHDPPPPPRRSTTTTTASRPDMLTVTNICRLPTKLRRRARRRRMATLWLLLLLVLLVVLLPLYAVYKPPPFLLRRLARRWPDVLWQVNGLPADRRVVALTIDDAPSDQTPAILDLLRRHRAKATFFVIGGQVEEGRAGLLRRIVREGHELANHAMHDEAAMSLPPAELEAQILRVRDMIREAYADAGRPDGPPYQYYRPGSGLFTDEMRRMVSRLGYRLVLGSIYPHDAQISQWRVNARHILSMLRPGRIIICHDRRAWTIPMLQKVLPEAADRGYRFVSVTELLLEAEEFAEDGNK